MSLKCKVPPELKIQAVEDDIGSTQIKEELGIRLSTFQSWLRKYQMEGVQELYPKKGFTAYPSELKLEAVADYLSGGGSLDAMCRKHGISSHAVLQQWIALYNEGHRDFKMRRAQEENSMTERKKLSQEEKIQAVLHCIEHGLDYRQTSEQYQIAYQSVIRRKKKRYVMIEPRITAENLLNREFAAETPNQKWLTDITECKLHNGQKAYLSAILDLEDNGIVSMC